MRANGWSVGGIDGFFEIGQVNFIDEISHFLEPFLLGLFPANPDIIFVYHVVTQQIIIFHFALYIVHKAFNLLFLLLESLYLFFHFSQALVCLALLQLFLERL
jgi:hypothetical protein